MAASSQGKNAGTDGKDIGADIVSLVAAEYLAVHGSLGIRDIAALAEKIKKKSRLSKR